MLRDDDAARGVGLPVAVVIHETAAEHVVAPVHLLAVDLVRQRAVEAVVRRAQGDDGLAGIHILHDEFALGHGEREQSGKEDDEVGGSKLLKSGDVVFFERLSLFGIHRHRRVHLALFIHAKKHRAIKAVMRAENLRHHRHGLLAAIFLIRRDEHDALPLPRPLAAGIRQPLRVISIGAAAG